jgi:hypothetical protein
VPNRVQRCALALSTAAAALVAPAVASAAPGSCAPTWTLVGTDEFRGASALTRSQGATTDGQGWFFSWQGGLERTDDAYLTQAAGAWPAQQAVDPQVNSDGTNHVGSNHIGDIDYYDGKIYAPFEDGGEDAGVTQVNDPEYQTPYIEVYDAQTLTNIGSYALDKDIHEAGVPWVSVNAEKKEVYTAEWDMPHDRINVFDLQMHFQRFLPLVYPPALGAGFHLSRIQGAKVYGNTLYASRDDADKSVYSVDLTSGVVTKLFALNPDVPAELEGLSVRPMPDGSLLHLLIVLDNQEDPTDPNSANIHTAFEHFAPVAPAGCPAPSLAEVPVAPLLVLAGVTAAVATATRSRWRRPG